MQYPRNTNMTLQHMFKNKLNICYVFYCIFKSKHKYSIFRKHNIENRMHFQTKHSDIIAYKTKH